MFPTLVIYRELGLFEELFLLLQHSLLIFANNWNRRKKRIYSSSLYIHSLLLLFCICVFIFAKEIGKEREKSLAAFPLVRKLHLPLTCAVYGPCPVASIEFFHSYSCFHKRKVKEIIYHLGWINLFSAYRCSLSDWSEWFRNSLALNHEKIDKSRSRNHQKCETSDLLWFVLIKIVLSKSFLKSDKECFVSYENSFIGFWNNTTATNCMILCEVTLKVRCVELALYNLNFKT